MNHLKKRRLEHWHIITFLLICYDLFAIAASYFLALLLRFDFRYGNIPGDYLHEYFITIPFYAVISLIIFIWLHLYMSIWRFASYRELYNLIIATVIDFVIYIAGSWIAVGRMPVSYYVFGIILQFVLTMSIRFSYRFVLLMRGRNSKEAKRLKHVMIVGAGNSGQALLRDIKASKETSEKVCCFIDDNPNKWNRYIDGVPVAGGREKILDACKEHDIEKIYVSVPSATIEQRTGILNICKESRCELLNLPGMYQFMTGQITVSAMKEVDVEDLLGREPIKVVTEEIFDHIRDKVILVTGAGGSIGSELCRQIASHQPRKLLLLDIYENSLHSIRLELKHYHPDLDLEFIVGSIRDSRKIFQVFETYRPQLVYHAAAHKHVPLMEDSPCEAIKNNAIGTYKTAFAAAVHGCEKFLLISTDKAVNPTNIMGASKRLCEMIIQAFDYRIRNGKGDEFPQLYTHGSGDIMRNPDIIRKLRESKTEFAAVRFGNVLGSNGSVIPLFKKQISVGGPVTVTHPDIIRYFMTIPEAVSLVLQAGVYAHGGEIFVLDMGDPVKIDDLARNLIKLSGHEPDVDIKIEYTGLRPGEKLYEEKLMAEEGLRTTDNSLIHIGNPIPFDIEKFLGQLEGLMEAAYKNKANIREYVQDMVSTYHPA